MKTNCWFFDIPNIIYYKLESKTAIKKYELSVRHVGNHFQSSVRNISTLILEQNSYTTMYMNFFDQDILPRTKFQIVYSFSLFAQYRIIINFMYNNEKYNYNKKCGRQEGRTNMVCILRQTLTNKLANNVA